jgi:hypothetical protein
MLCLLCLLMAAPPVSKVQLHAHSGRSGDSRTPPADVARWYAARGYDAVVLTDHNVVAPLPEKMPPLLPGAELTVNLRGCLPITRPDRFCPLHVNALFIDPTRKPTQRFKPGSLQREAIFGAAIDLAHQLGGVAQINHPNFHAAIDAKTIVALARAKGPLLLEVRNEAVDSENEGGDGRPSTEALWDAVLTAGVDVWATATDDAHHYYDAAATRARGHIAHTGDRGFVMVRAPAQADALRAALRKGDFYASTGVILKRWSVQDGALHIEVKGTADRVRFIGTNGRLLQQTKGGKAAFRVSDAAGGYVRAVVDAGSAQAWTQPIRVPGVPTAD